MDESRFDELFQAVGRIEGKIDALNPTEIEKRISALEKWKAKVVGVCAAIAALLTTGINVISYHWSAKF